MSSKIINKYSDKFYELNSHFYMNIKKNIKNISFIFVSTLQVRLDPLTLSYFFTKYKIPIIAFQETHQFYLHNEEMNNYILPSDQLLVSSKFEESIFLKYGYLKNTTKVIGWDSSYLTNNKLYLDYNNYILIILNASNKINPISIETLSIQINFINKIYNNLGPKYKYVVKMHPADDQNNFFIIKNKICKNIKIIFDEYDTINLIQYSNLIFSTGYTQSILEAIFLNKKIYIYSIENNQNILIKNSNVFNNFDNLSQKINKYNYLDSKNIYKLNELDKTKKIFINNILSYLDNKNFSNYEDLRIINLIDLSIWLYYFGKYKKSKQIIFYLNNLKIIKFSKVLKLLMNFHLKKYLLDEIDQIFIFLKNKNSYFAFKYIIISDNNSLLKDQIFSLNHIYVNEPKYLSNIFFYRYQEFLNLLLYYNKLNDFYKYSNHHFLSNKKLYNSKSKILRLYFLIRRSAIIFRFLPFSYIFNYKLYKKLFIK